jgi:iron(III) transport system ATP-binding protein
MAREDGMLRVAHLSKIFENQTDQIVGGIRDASFELEAGSFFTLLGPSGCGKTTTLRCIAGLETPDAGAIDVDGRRLFDAAAHVNVPVEQRAVGMVFQSYAIWPHMTVAENVAFPLTVAKGARRSRAEIAEAVRRALSVVDLDGFQERSATRLSGGQQQRVALARAVVHEPRLLLLDEPLSNLDAQLRDDMRGELKRLQHKIGITTVYVTHDQSEALALSDRLAVIDQGRIIQIGSPHDIYFLPANPFVARFVGATNLLPARLLEVSAGEGRAEVLSGRAIRCAVPQAIEDPSAVSVSIRPESIRLKPRLDGAAPAPGNCLPGRISGVTFLGAANRIDVESDGVALQVSVPSDLPLPSDPEVWLLFDPDRAVALPGREG